MAEKKAATKSTLAPVLGCVCIVKNVSKKDLKIFASERVRMILKPGDSHIVRVTPWLVASAERGEIEVLDQSKPSRKSWAKLYEKYSPAPESEEDED